VFISTQNKIFSENWSFPSSEFLQCQWLCVIFSV